MKNVHSFRSNLASGENRIAGTFSLKANFIKSDNNLLNFCNNKEPWCGYHSHFRDLLDFFYILWNTFHIRKIRDNVFLGNLRQQKITQFNNKFIEVVNYIDIQQHQFEVETKIDESQKSIKVENFLRASWPNNQPFNHQKSSDGWWAWRWSRTLNRVWQANETNENLLFDIFATLKATENEKRIRSHSSRANNVSFSEVVNRFREREIRR